MQRQLLGDPAGIKADLLQVSRHSRGFISDSFKEAVSPEYIVFPGRARKEYKTESISIEDSGAAVFRIQNGRIHRER